MPNIDTDPIYKLFCMAAVLLIPLLPAILLYEIAPKEKFFSSGNFSGFKINATGASAIYIILFIAFYAKVDVILLHIDEYSVLQQNLKALPWRVDCNVKLIDIHGRTLGAWQTEDIINRKNVECNPYSPNLDNNAQTISFYVENKDVDKIGKIKGGMVGFKNNYGSVAIDTITPTKRDSLGRVITLEAVFKEQSTATYSVENTLHTTHGFSQPPKPQL